MTHVVPIHNYSKKDIEISFEVDDQVELLEKQNLQLQPAG
jgi:hypothetical protein